MIDLRLYVEKKWNKEIYYLAIFRKELQVTQLWLLRLSKNM